MDYAVIKHITQCSKLHYTYMHILNAIQSQKYEKYVNTIKKNYGKH